MWDTFTSRIVISAELRAVTALRVGAGGDESAQPTASDLPVLVGADGQPFIPGSSVRGVVRSQVERIVRTLEQSAQAGHGACNPVSEKQWCIPAVRLNGEDGRAGWRGQAREHPDPDAWLAEQIWQNTCRVCRVFGSPWLASRVRIADLRLLDGQSGRIERRDGVSIDRDKETVANKYDFETVPAGTAFQLRVTGENLDDAEKGLLWLGLSELREGHVLLGGFKGRGLGQATLTQVQIAGVEARDRTALRAYVLKRTLQPIDEAAAEGWLAALWKSLEAD